MNLQFNSELLEPKIVLLENKNLEIENTMKKINDILNSLDDKVWKTAKKAKFENELKPYVSNMIEIEKTNLENCILLLRKAISRYKSAEDTISNEASKFSI